MMGGALGLAILASIAASRTDSLRAGGDSAVAALNGGYHAAFLVGAAFALGAALVSTVFFRANLAQAHAGHEAAGRGRR